jgi:hypothetical protein
MTTLRFQKVFTRETLAFSPGDTYAETMTFPNERHAAHWVTAINKLANLPYFVQLLEPATRRHLDAWCEKQLCTFPDRLSLAIQVSLACEDEETAAHLIECGWPRVLDSMPSALREFAE